MPSLMGFRGGAGLLLGRVCMSQYNVGYEHLAISLVSQQVSKNWIKVITPAAVDAMLTHRQQTNQ